MAFTRQPRRSTGGSAGDDIAGSRAHVAHARPRSGCSSDEEVAAVIAALDHVEEELARRDVRVRPTDEDIHTAVERRVTELAGRGRRQAAHRAQPQRPGRDRPAPLPAREASWPSPLQYTALQEVLVAPGDGGRRRLPARLHAPAARPAGAARAPPARPRLGARPRRRPAGATRSTAPTCRRSAPARSPARACRSIPTTSPPSSASPAGSRTRSTRCRTATSSPRRCSPPR